MKDKLSVKPKILDLNNTNDIYMTLNICILSNDVNYNKAQFLDDFIDGVIENKETYVGIPFLVNREKLESAEYDSLTHEFKDGKLLTDQIGSFVNFWKEEIDDANCLMGEIRIMKRFPNTCNAIIELYNDGELETSCEVLISSYSEISEDGVRKIGYSSGANALIGSCLVSEPAEKRAKATILVAEAYQKDTEIDKKGDVTVSKTEVFNKGHEIEYKGTFETASLKFSEISNQIYNKLNPINAKTSGRQYNYYIHTLYNDSVIVEDWDDYEILYRIPYSIENDEVTLSPKEQWEQGKLGFIANNNVEVASLLSDKEKELSDVQDKLTKAKEELSTMSEQNIEQVASLEATIKELNEKVTSLEGTVAELNATIVGQEEAKTGLEGQITELNSTVEELSKYKEQVETAEKEEKVAELNSKYSKLLSEETFKSVEVQEAISKMDIQELNSIVVSEMAKQKVEVEVASKEDKSVTIVASKQEDLIPQSLLQKYGIEA